MSKPHLCERLRVQATDGVYPFYWAEKETAEPSRCFRYFFASPIAWELVLTLPKALSKT